LLIGQLLPSRRALWAVGAVVLPAALSFASGPLLARSMSLESRGSLAQSIALLNLFVFLLDLGMSNSLLVANARAGARSLPVERTTLLVYSCASALALGCTVPLWSLSHSLELSLAVGLAPLLVFPNISRSSAQARSQTNLLAAERWAQTVSRLLMLACLASVGTLTARAGLLTQVLSSLFGAAFLLNSYFRGPRSAAPTDLRPISFGAETLGAGLATTVMLRLDQLLIPVVSTQHQLGLYAVAVSISEVPSMMSAATKLHFQGQIASSRSARKLFPWLALAPLACLTGAALSLPLGGDLLALLFGSAYRAAAPILTLLLVAASGLVLLDLAGSACVCLGYARGQTLPALLAAAVTAMGLVPAISVWGASGAALVSAFSYISAACLALFLLVRFERGPASLPQGNMVRDHDSSLGNEPEGGSLGMEDNCAL
jgi:O-antigen/teichoic acid export membrane protein